MPQRYAVTFHDGWANDPQPVEIVYWVSETGHVDGEAYFKRDDYCVPITNGDFQHPFSGLQYKLHVPGPRSKSPDCLLSVMKWFTVGRQKPKVCENQKEVTP